LHRARGHEQPEAGRDLSGGSAVIEIVPGDAALHLEVEGEGPLVVLLHGFGGSARNWRPQLRALRDRFRVAAFDVRGHARERRAPPQRNRPERFVADLARVLDHLGAARAVVGRSLDGRRNRRALRGRASARVRVSYSRRCRPAPEAGPGSAVGAGVR
jgi:pimeloyl-ACP methyl ester carboxylesterase